MPTWSDILLEMKESASRGGPPAWDEVRRKHLKNLSRYTRKNTILYATKFTGRDPSIPSHLISIIDEDVQGLMEVIHGLKGRDLDLILHSPGGSLDATVPAPRYRGRDDSAISILTRLQVAPQKRNIYKMKHKNYDSHGVKVRCQCGLSWRASESNIPIQCKACKWLASFFVGAYIPPKTLEELNAEKKRRCKPKRSTQRHFLPPLALTCVDRAMAKRKQQMATVRAARAGLELRWLTPREKLKAMPPPRCIVMWDGVDAPKASVTGSPNWRQKGSGQGIDREDSPMWHNVVRAIEDG